MDDGYCQDCITQYIAFAQRSGIHLTLHPNGIYRGFWTPTVVAQVREMAANKQLQFGNHTWDHKDLTKLSDRAIGSELTRNEVWIEDTFGVTGRPTSGPLSAPTTPGCSRSPASSATPAS